MKETIYREEKEKEFQKIYDLYVENVYRLCFSYLKNRMDAEDVMQETFLKLYQKDDIIQPPEEAKAWLLVTASNACKNLLKHWWRKHRNLEDYTEILGKEEERERELMDLVMNLPVKYKTAVYLYYYEGYNSRQIAKMLHKPESTVRTHLQKAREILKKWMAVQ